MRIITFIIEIDIFLSNESISKSWKILVREMISNLMYTRVLSQGHFYSISILIDLF